VLKIVREKLNYDSARDESSAVDEKDLKKIQHSKTLCDIVDRSVIKQTVMTSVYGVTRIGARDQVGDGL